MNILDTAWGIIIIIAVLKYGFPLLDSFMKNVNEEMKKKSQ